MSFHFLISK